VSGRPSVPAATASRPAETIMPAMPELRPVASEEHEVDDTLTEMLPPKYVQPSMYSQEAGSTPRTPKPRIEFTTIAWTEMEGSLWCHASSSAAEAIPRMVRG